jgi:hypothetical protein
MDEADAMAERVIVVDHGRVIADDTADRLKADLAGYRIVVTTRAPGRLAELARRLRAREVTVEACRVEARVADGPRALPALLAAAAAAAGGGRSSPGGSPPARCSPMRWPPRQRQPWGSLSAFASWGEAPTEHCAR